MKKAILLCMFATVTLISCKYEEGPALSLRSRKARVAGEWTLEQYLYNGSDQTSVVTALQGSSYTTHLEKDGTYHIHGNFEDEGTWELAEGGKEIHFKSNAAGSETEHYEILKLKNKEMWIRHSHDSETIEYHYKQ